MKSKSVFSKGKSILMLCLFIMVTATAFSQQSTITGKVVDESGDPLPGVTVMKKGTTEGTITDINGQYSITNVSVETVLVYSFIGMSDQEVLVANQTSINITLISDMADLDEVVVVGFGSQKKATLTGSVEQVKAEVFEDRAVSNPALALQGQSPGLVVTRSSSKPGDEGIDFSIRGTNSINEQSPLIIIDGIATLGNSAFTSLNPDDIESISVLKDGAAAIYGSRASNGVIIVTTKKGKGDIKVNISSQMRINTIGITPKLASNPQEYGQAWLDYCEQDELAGLTPKPWAFTVEQFQWMADGNTGYINTPYWGDTYIGNNYNYDDLYGTSYSQQHTASVSGGSESSDFRISAGFIEDMGAIKPTYDGKKQFNFRGNYNFDINKWFRVETSTSYFKRTLDGPLYGGSRAFTQDPPLWPVVNPFGQWGSNFGQRGGGINPIARMVDGGRDTGTREEFRLKVSGILQLTSNLKFRADAAIDRAWQRTQQYQLIVPTYSWAGERANATVNKTSYIQEASNEDQHETYQGIFDYTKKVGDHNFSLMAGMSAERRTRKQLSGYRRDFEDYGIYDLNLGSIETLVEAKGGAANWGLASYLARFNYGYQSKYLVELQGRRDGSSKFDEGYKWKNFFGGSLGWVVTEEGFLKDNEVLNFLKLRASYGELGNQGGIGNHDYASLVSFGTTYFGQQSLNLYTTATANTITTNARTWETIKTTNFGLDFRMLDNRLSGAFDYFFTKNEDMLISVTYPDVLGGNPKTTNSGVLETNGWEVVVGWRDQVGEVQYNVSVNMSDTRNKLVSMEGADTWKEGLVGRREGYALNTYFLYKTDGYFATQEEAEAYYDKYNSITGGELPQDAKLRAGDAKYVDVDGNGYIHAIGDGVNDTGDLVDSGDATPHYVYGINLGLKWRNWDFNTFFQGVLEHNVLRAGQAAYPRDAHFTNQNIAYNDKTWTPDNTGAQYPRMSSYNTIAKWNYEYTDFMLMKGRYLRCKTLSLGYTFSDIQIRDFNISRLRLFFTGNDLFEFTNLDSGWDPEFGSSADASYPFMRTWALGLNLTF